MGILTQVFLPLALAIIMFGMGLSLVTEDFKRILRQPLPILLGLLLQLCVLPLLGLGLISVFDLTGSLAVGLFLLAVCPGGATSNLIAHLAKGDAALSVSLTAFSSCITVFSIPLLMNWALVHYVGAEKAVELPVLKTIGQIFAITLLPVGIGMWIRAKYGAWALAAEPKFRKASAIFFAIIVLAAVLKERANLLPYFLQAGPAALSLNLASMALGFGMARLFQLSFKQGITLSIETGIQNGTLGIAIATGLLEDSTMSIPPAIYSLLMFGTAYLLIAFSLRMQAKNQGLEV